MYNEDVKNFIEMIPNGQMIRVMHQTELPVKAAYKKQGIRVLKVSETTFRTGVDYDNMQSTKEFVESQENYVKQSRSYYEWVVENKIRHHVDKDRYYLHVATVPEHSNTKTTYILYVNDTESFVDKEAIVEFVQNSYFNRPASSGATVKDIAFDNILMIGEFSLI